MLDGEPVLLCWLEGEAQLGWYHKADHGFAGRHRSPPIAPDLFPSPGGLMPDMPGPDDALAAALYRLLGADDGNLVFSPASFGAAPRVALCGARSPTAAEIRGARPARTGGCRRGASPADSALPPFPGRVARP